MVMEHLIYFTISIHNRIISYSPLVLNEIINITRKLQKIHNSITYIIVITTYYLSNNTEYKTQYVNYPKFEILHEDFLFNTERLIYYIIHLIFFDIESHHSHHSTQ